MFRRPARRDPDYDFFDRFGDPSAPSIGDFPPTRYPNVPINAAAQIRVVQVLSGAFEDGICCRLETVDLTDADQATHVSFSALSYTWGGFANPGSITLNGVTGFPVSQNLYCFLERYRSMEQASWLWIDQICMNQHDQKEKSLQVPLMENIYTRAAEVIIWLGDHAPGSQSSQSRSQQLEKIISYAFGRTDGGLCWWRRLWVLQEYSLASKDPVVQIGSGQIPWVELCRFTSKYLRGARSALPAANAFFVLNNMIERFTVVRQTAQKDRTLLALAWVFPQLICFRPKDKIYGLFGLLAPELKAVLKLDYQQTSVRDVFSQATFAEIVYTKSLGILALARHKTITEALPSWAVDFVYPQEQDHVTIPILMTFWLELFQRQPRPWTRISSQAKASVHLDVENTFLTIGGLVFDQVLLALPMANVAGQDGPQVSSWQKLALTSTSLTSRLILKKEERSFRQQVLAHLESQSAYHRLSGGEEAFSSPLIYELPAVRRILVDTIVIDWLRHEIHSEHECVEEEMEEDDAFPAAWDGYFNHLASNFETTDLSTSFFITKTGFVGFGPQHMRTGDRIILPYGSRYPMLLRADVDDTWNFLGFVYVTGIGNNQLCTLLSDLKLQEQCFKLK